MQQTFKHPFSVPPGRRWFFQVPDGKFVETVGGMDECVALAQREYIAMGQGVPMDLAVQIQDYMCQRLPDGFCTGKPTIRNPRYHDVLHATANLVKNAKSKGGFGNQKMQDIERRAAVCMNCPKHDMTMCITCNGLLAAFRENMVGRRTPYDRSLRVCRCTAALLTLQVNTDADKITALDPLPDNCWIKKELENG